MQYLNWNEGKVGLKGKYMYMHREQYYMYYMYLVLIVFRVGDRKSEGRAWFYVIRIIIDKRVQCVR